MQKWDLRRKIEPFAIQFAKGSRSFAIQMGLQRALSFFWYNCIGFAKILSILQYTGWENKQLNNYIYMYFEYEVCKDAELFAMQTGFASTWRDS